MEQQLSFLQPILGLVFVLILIGFLFWMIKSLQNKKNIFGTRSIQIIEATSVGTREKIILVDVGDKRLVLGVTSQNINVLTELRHEAHDEPKTDFSKTLKQADKVESKS
jgi:flagellar protein FliO/FliZ